MTVELEHTSSITRANSEQAIQFSVEANAIGDAALAVSQLNLGCDCTFEGFWAPAHYRTKRITFHILSVVTD